MLRMRMAVIIVTTAVIMSSTMGCIGKDPFWQSPISRLPRLILDHVTVGKGVPENETRIYVMAIEDHRYAQINITVSSLNGTMIDTHLVWEVYSTNMSVNVSSFLLRVKVLDMDGDTENWFEFLGLVEVYTKPNVPLTITEKDPKKGTNLGDPKEVTTPPWRTLLDRAD